MPALKEVPAKASVADGMLADREGVAGACMLPARGGIVLEEETTAGARDPPAVGLSDRRSSGLLRPVDAPVAKGEGAPRGPASTPVAEIG
jgi:hypothetical protein